VEIIIALAVIGVLSSVAVLGMRAFLDTGAMGALEADQELLQQAVDAFRSDRHKGLNGSNLWGQVTPAQRLYPTKNGLVADLELGTATDTSFTDRSNLKVHVYAAGSSFGVAATGANITAGAAWVGLLVNEPVAAGVENDKPGLAHPIAGEKGQYLLEFPASASETNTDIDTAAGNLNGKTNGSFTWIILHNGRVVPAYLGSDGNWYSGSDNRYP
jgi:type II secretory pathway pseudopilin PulG